MRLSQQLARRLRLIFPKRTLGERGEALAARYLKRRGYKIIAVRSRDYLGELDLVAVLGETIVFVEVKTRRSSQKGHASEAVDFRKQRKLTRLATSWLKRHGLLGHSYSTRFDIVAITWPKESRSPKIEHFENAFEAVGD